MKMLYRNFIRTMPVISVSLTPKLEKGISELIDDGVVGNKADAVKKGLELLLEQHAVDVVLKAEKELGEGKVLRGDLDELLKKF